MLRLRLFELGQSFRSRTPSFSLRPSGFGNAPTRLERVPIDWNRHYVRRSNPLVVSAYTLDCFASLAMTGGPASSGQALAATVDAAILHAIGAIPAQSICLGLPWSGNVGPEKARREESRCRRDLRDGARIDGIVMQGQMTADRRSVASVRNRIGRGQSQSRQHKAASQRGLNTPTS
jgi:hypothetical protein